MLPTRNLIVVSMDYHNHRLDHNSHKSIAPISRSFWAAQFSLRSIQQQLCRAENKRCQPAEAGVLHGSHGCSRRCAMQRCSHVYTTGSIRSRCPTEKAQDVHKRLYKYPQQISSRSLIPPCQTHPTAKATMVRYMIIDDTDPALVYSGDWRLIQTPLNPKTPEYNGTVHATNDSNATVTYSFNGQLGLVSSGISC